MSIRHSSSRAMLPAWSLSQTRGSLHQHEQGGVPCPFLTSILEKSNVIVDNIEAGAWDRSEIIAQVVCAAWVVFR